MNRPNVRLYRGDCLKIMKRLPAGSVDAVVADPPYGIGLADHDPNFSLRRTSRRIRGDENQDTGNEILRWAASQELPTAVFASPYKPWSGQWRNLLVWDKGPATGRGGDPRKCWKRTWELIQVAQQPLRSAWAAAKRYFDISFGPIVSSDIRRVSRSA